MKFYSLMTERGKSHRMFNSMNNSAPFPQQRRHLPPVATPALDKTLTGLEK